MGQFSPIALLEHISAKRALQSRFSCFVLFVDFFYPNKLFDLFIFILYLTVVWLFQKLLYQYRAQYVGLAMGTEVCNQTTIG